MYLPDEPLPEGHRLGVGVVHAEDAHAPRHPEANHRQHLREQPLAVFGVEVQGVDVLVLFGRVLGELDAAVGAPLEPLGMLGDPGVIRRGLQGKVQGCLHALLAAGALEAREVLQGAQLGLHSLVSSQLVAHRVGAAGAARGADQAVVGALAVGASDGVDGRQVDHCKTHLADLRQAALHVGEGGAAALHRALGSRPHLVPRGVPGLRAIGEHLQRARQPGPVATVGVLAHDQLQLLAQNDLGHRVPGSGQPGARGQAPQHQAHLGQGSGDGLTLAVLFFNAVHQRQRPVHGRGGRKLLFKIDQYLLQPAAVLLTGPCQDLLHQYPPLLQLAGEVQARVVFFAQVRRPGEEGVAPGQHRVLVGAVLLQAEGAPPAVVTRVRKLHGRLLPGVGPFWPPQQHRPQHLVTVGEDVRLHLEQVPHHALDRVAPAVEAGGDVFDYHRVDVRIHRGLLAGSYPARRNNTA